MSTKKVRGSEVQLPTGNFPPQKTGAFETLSEFPTVEYNLSPLNFTIFSNVNNNSKKRL